MLKKAGFVAATAVGLCLLGGTAYAAPTESPEGHMPDGDGYVTFEDAYHQFIEGGAALGYGAASLVAGAYTGIIQTPQNVLDNYEASRGN